MAEKEKEKQAAVAETESSKEHTHRLKLKNEEKFGEVRIADEVVAMIAELAASEVEGVASMAGGATRELIEKLGRKSLSRGVRITMENNQLFISLAVNIRFGYSVPDTCAKIQERVRTAVETMTGLEVAKVNIKIVNVTLAE